MISSKLLSRITFLLCSLFCFNSFGQSPINLKTEYLVNPVGLDNPNPRFTWQMNDKRMGAKQTAYRLMVSTDSLGLVQGKANLWNTGWL
ncbi:MAG: hypothetical protein EOO90_29860, partial [Pedobacter sp.]